MRFVRGRRSKRETVLARNAQFAYLGLPEQFQQSVPPKRDRVRRPVDGRPAAPLEKDIQRAILDAIALRRDVIFVGRFNRGQAVATDSYGNTRYTPFNSVRGFPDIHGLLVGGRAFYLEVKRPGAARPSPDQLEFIDKVRRGGGIAGIAFSVDDALKILP